MLFNSSTPVLTKIIENEVNEVEKDKVLDELVNANVEEEVGKEAIDEVSNNDVGNKRACKRNQPYSDEKEDLNDSVASAASTIEEEEEKPQRMTRRKMALAKKARKESGIPKLDKYGT